MNFQPPLADVRIVGTADSLSTVRYTDGLCNVRPSNQASLLFPRSSLFGRSPFGEFSVGIKGFKSRVQSSGVQTMGSAALGQPVIVSVPPLHYVAGSYGLHIVHQKG